MGTTRLGWILAALFFLSAQAWAGYQPVLLSDGFGNPITSTGNALNVSGTVAVTNPSVGPTASPAPSSATLVGAKDQSGNLAPLQVDASGKLITATSPAGRSVVSSLRNVYSSVNVTTGAWVQLVASTSSAVTLVEDFDSSGQTLELGTGGSGSEVHLVYLFPGGNGQIPVAIPVSTRIAIRAVSANATSGELDMNLYN